MSETEPTLAIGKTIDALVDALTRPEWERDDAVTAKAVHEIGRLFMELEARVARLERIEEGRA